MSAPSPLVEYKGYYSVPELPDDVLNEWKETLKNEMARIYNGLITRIPDETAFRTIIAESAYQSWQNFINPDWENADLIKLKYQVKLTRAYPAWKTGIDNAFNGSAPYFADRVEQKAEKFRNAKYTLGVVGLRYKYGRGIAVKAIGVISGDYRVLKDIKAPDEFTGNIVNVFLPGAARFVRPQAIAIITQGLVLAYYAHEAGLTTIRDNVISSVNTTLQNTVLKQVDTSKYSVVLEIGYDATSNALYVHSRAEQVTS